MSIFFREDEYLVNMQHTVIPSWYQREGYIKAMADLMEKELKSFERPGEVVSSLFFTGSCYSYLAKRVFIFLKQSPSFLIREAAKYLCICIFALIT